MDITGIDLIHPPIFTEYHTLPHITVLVFPFQKFCCAQRNQIYQICMAFFGLSGGAENPGQPLAAWTTDGHRFGSHSVAHAVGSHDRGISGLSSPLRNPNFFSFLFLGAGALCLWSWDSWDVFLVMATKKNISLGESVALSTHSFMDHHIAISSPHTSEDEEDNTT